MMMDMLTDLPLMKRVTLFLLIVGVLTGCQEPTQPYDLVKNRTVSVEVRRTNGDPVPSATITWQRITGVDAPAGGLVQTGADGVARVQVANVSIEGDTLQMNITPPNVDLVMNVCADTNVVLSVDTTIPCGTMDIRDTIYLDACPTRAPGSAAECRVYPTDCPQSLLVETSDSAVGDITIQPSALGVSRGMIEVCVSFAPEPASPQQQEHTVTIEGRDPTGGGPLVRIALTIIGRVECTDCPCPTLSNVADTTDTACYSVPTVFDVDMAMAGATVGIGSDCTVLLELISNSHEGQVAVTSGSRFTLRNGQRIPNLRLTINASPGPTELVTTLTYRVRTQRSDGVIQECAPNLIVTVVTPLTPPDCRIEPDQTDTLRKCVYNDESTTDTVFLVNDGLCLAEFQVTVSGPFTTNLSAPTVVVPPRSRIPVVVSFTATKGDWDRNNQQARAPRGTKFFAGQLRIQGCATATLGLVGNGYIDCSAFKYSCLREFRPAAYPNVYAESIELLNNRAQILYQNDNQTFRRFDIWFDEIRDLGGGTYEATLSSGDGAQYRGGRFYRVAQNFFVSPGTSICETYPSQASQECELLQNDGSQGQASLAGVRVGDVLLFVTANGECALIWVQSIGLDRSGANALPAACIEICYPMFTTP